MVGIVRGVWTVGRNRDAALTAVSAKNAELVRFQSLVETSGDFIAMAQPDGAVLYVNPAGRRLVGVEDRDVTRMNIADFLTEEGLAASIAVEQPAVVAEGRWSGQSTLRDHRGGPPIPVAIASFLMRDPETGEPSALATVQRDISDRVAAQTAVERLADERQHLLDRLVQAQEDERARIAADVHDDSVQALAAVELRLGLLRRQLGDSPVTLLQTAETLSETVSEAIGRLRTLLFDLESPAVGTDLATALGVAAENTFEDRLAWSIVGATDLDVPEGQRVTAYRIAKEAMANVVKHADARAVVVTLARAGNGFEVVVEDDGRGFDPSTVEARPGPPGHSGDGRPRDDRRGPARAGTPGRGRHARTPVAAVDRDRALVRLRAPGGPRLTVPGGPGSGGARSGSSEKPAGRRHGGWTQRGRDHSSGGGSAAHGLRRAGTVKREGRW